MGIMGLVPHISMVDLQSSEFKRFQARPDAADTIRGTKHEDLIEELLEKYRDAVAFPDTAEFLGGNFELYVRMHEAALNSPPGDDAAIEKAIRDECKRLLDQYGVKRKSGGQQATT